MDDLRTTTAIVKEVLENNPQTRNSDNILYLAVCDEIGKLQGIDINKMSMKHILLNLKEFKMPQFETVRRTRQKLQATHPELAADSNIEAYRVMNEEVFRDYARQVMV